LGLSESSASIEHDQRTAYLAIGTWVVAELMMLAAGKLTAFGGGSGTSVPISIVLSFGKARGDRLATIYWLAFGLAALAMLMTYFLLRSRIGIGLTAMRDNEEGAAAIGVNITYARVLCFLGTAPFLGMAGGIITLQKLRIAPSASFSIIDWTVFIIFNVVIGGIGSFEGPIVGTIIYFVLRQYLADLGAWNLILLGGFSIAIILIDKRGLWGLIESCQMTSFQSRTNRLPRSYLRRSVTERLELRSVGASPKTNSHPISVLGAHFFLPPNYSGKPSRRAPSINLSASAGWGSAYSKLDFGQF
jgi:hypothetical protein